MLIQICGVGSWIEHEWRGCCEDGAYQGLVNARHVSERGGGRRRNLAVAPQLKFQSNS
jgi:hypothetical protein